MLEVDNGENFLLAVCGVCSLYLLWLYTIASYLKQTPTRPTPAEARRLNLYLAHHSSLSYNKVKVIAKKIENALVLIS